MGYEALLVLAYTPSKFWVLSELRVAFVRAIATFAADGSAKFPLAFLTATTGKPR